MYIAVIHVKELKVKAVLNYIFQTVTLYPSYTYSSRVFYLLLILFV